MNELMHDNPFMIGFDVMKYLVLIIVLLFLIQRVMTKFQKQDKWLLVSLLWIGLVSWFPVLLFNPYSIALLFTLGVVFAGYDFHTWRESKTQQRVFAMMELESAAHAGKAAPFPGHLLHERRATTPPTIATQTLADVASSSPYEDTSSCKRSPMKFIDTVDWSTVSQAGKEKAASHMVLPGEWSRAELLAALKNSGSDELDDAQERISSKEGPLVIAELDLLWHEVSRAADHQATLSPVLEALEARLAKTVIKAWQAYSTHDHGS